MPDLEKPLLIGLKAARANLIPGLIIQAMMLAVVLAYYWNDATRSCLNELARWKEQSGYLFSVTLAMFAGAVLPGMLKVLVFQRGRVKKEDWETFLFAAVFWGFSGACVDTMYRLQAIWFGTGHTFSVLAKKVIVDQFVYNPLWASPLTARAYEWRNRGYKTAGLPGFFTFKYYREQILPLLISTWGVWLPVVAIIYSLPSLLQIPLFGLALGFWVLIVTFISSSKSDS